MCDVPGTDPARPFVVKELAVLAGIDTHKDTLAVAVIEAAGRPLARCELPIPRSGSPGWRRCWPSMR